MTRREFIQNTIALVGTATLGGPGAFRAEGSGEIAGAIVICNHWTQFGIGETFPEGEARGRWYQKNFSVVYGLEEGRRWLEANPGNRVCHELDAYFLEALAAEDPAYLNVVRRWLDEKRMELPGGMFGQAESQVFGYESAIRQLTFGQAAYRRYLGRGVDTFIVEEQCFYPQLPQLLKLSGFKHASIQFQNSGTPESLPQDLILWEAMDGSTIPTIPGHPGMVACPYQYKSYDEVVKQLAGRKAPLIFQWMELWPPGLDWGASIAPYREAIQALERQGFRQMLLSEYIEWALGRCEMPRVRFPLDQSHYNNNFFQGGWGYENERTARASNRCESLLLAVEALCAGGRAQGLVRSVGGRLRDLWSRVLVAQCHDPYLAGTLPAYIDGFRSFQSELAAKQFATVQRALREEGGLDVPLSGKQATFRLFNPCAWEVNTPVLLELGDLAWPEHSYRLMSDRRVGVVGPVFRSDSGAVVVGPSMVRMPPYGALDLRLEPCPGTAYTPAGGSARLVPKQDGRVWGLAQTPFAGIEFEPLVGQWRQAPSYFDSAHPNTAVEAAHTQLEAAPTALPLRRTSAALDTATWRRDLMRIREVQTPALSVQGLVFTGDEPVPWVQFNQRLTGTIRFQTGKRPDGVWRFRLRGPGKGLRVFADAPFSEELRAGDSFYCARYVRLEWPERQVLWCPSQNTLFRRLEKDGAVWIECTVFDFSFTGSACWEMRFYANRSFSAAESMRLAESFHRRPVRIPDAASGGRIAGVTADNAAVVALHVFAAGRGVAGVRVLNASNQPQTAAIAWPGGFRAVASADLDGNVLPAGWRHSGRSRTRWEYGFRPWEIATFRVQYA